MIDDTKMIKLINLLIPLHNKFLAAIKDIGDILIYDTEIHTGYDPITQPDGLFWLLCDHEEYEDPTKYPLNFTCARNGVIWINEIPDDIYMLQTENPLTEEAITKLEQICSAEMDLESDFYNCRITLAKENFIIKFLSPEERLPDLAEKLKTKGYEIEVSRDNTKLYFIKR